MRIGRLARPLGYSCLAMLVLMSAGRLRVLAQEEHSHVSMSEPTERHKNTGGELMRVVREATQRFQDPSAAERAGYSLQFGCVSGSDSGAMCMHFVNGALVNDGILDAT